MLYQILAVFFATISQISDGMVFGWASPALPILLAPNSPIPSITTAHIAWIESIYWIGGICGVPITIQLVHRIGRKGTLLFANSLNLAHWGLLLLATEPWQLYLARFLTGVSSDLAFVSAPMYIAEIASSNIRGILTSFTHMMVLAGILLIYSIMPFVPLAVTSGLGCLFLVIQLIALPFFPETPYYYTMKEDYQNALKSLKFFRPHESNQVLTEELTAIRECVAHETRHNLRFFDLFRVRSTRKSVFITVVLNAAQHFAGISVVIMNFQMILEDSVVLFDSKLTAIAFAALMLLSSIVATSVVDRFDRRILLVTSSVLTSISLALLAIFFKLKYTTESNPNIAYLPLIAIILYIVTFKLGLAIIPYIIVAEIFPTKSKAYGIAISDLSYVVFAAISIHFYQFTLERFGNFVPICTFSVCAMLTAVFVAVFVPETRGKSLHEIQSDLNKGNKASSYEKIEGTDGESSELLCSSLKSAEKSLIQFVDKT